MKRANWKNSGKTVGALFLAAACALPQANTISARPGRINYVDGDVFLDGHQISESSVEKTFVSANQTLSTNLGNAEVLLTPGVFLRIGSRTQIRMVSPSLTDAQVELISGEAMLEADNLLKENYIRIVNHRASVLIKKAGLYRFTADNPPAAAVITGKVEVSYLDKSIHIGKGREVVIVSGLPQQKFDRKKEDDLYAWSNVRSMYNAAASLQSAQTLSLSNPDIGNGFGGGYGPGWLWNDMFDSWAWLPFGDMAFFSPFGYGFYGPGAVGYAPICYAPINGRWGHWHGRGNQVPVAVNPQHPPTARPTASPWQNNLARASVARSFEASGFRTPAGGFVPEGAHLVSSRGFGQVSSGNGGHVGSANGGRVGGWAGGRGAVNGWSGGGGHTGSSGGHFDGGGFSGGGHAGAGGFGGGGHAGGGGGGHR